MRFNQFGDARIDKDQRDALLRELSHEIVELAKSRIIDVVYSTSAYTIVSATHESGFLSSELLSQIKEQLNQINWHDLTLEHHQMEVNQIKEDEEYGNELVPCHKCHTHYPRNTFSPVILSRSGINVNDTYTDHCYNLCPGCIQEYTYQFHGLHFTCTYCNNRYGFGNALPGMSQSKELCWQCQSQPAIKREEARVLIHVTKSKNAGLPATLTLNQWFTTLKYFNNKCAYCDGSFDVIEHYTPVSLRGGTTHKNCVPACDRCNARKNNRHPDKFERLFPTDNIARIKAYFASL